MDRGAWHGVARIEHDLVTKVKIYKRAELKKSERIICHWKSNVLSIVRGEMELALLSRKGRIGARECIFNNEEQELENISSLKKFAWDSI